eukprot:TRINITY_DN10939_c0_g1_i1.p1 TRINITY_DN10939_c0_g1~~TRINITY_DN10939_c0_g1_i1.p1  ORF type:complete len:252 (+),score=39.74 TRINITY_DN10939_c0_g1_i1:156-911(+)
MCIRDRGESDWSCLGQGMHQNQLLLSWIQQVLLPVYLNQACSRVRAIQMVQAGFNMQTIDKLEPTIMVQLLALLQAGCKTTKDVTVDALVSLMQAYSESCLENAALDRQWIIWCKSVSLILTQDVLQSIGIIEHAGLDQIEADLASHEPPKSDATLAHSAAGIKLSALLNHRLSLQPGPAPVADSPTLALDRMSKLPISLLERFCGLEHAQNIWRWVSAEIETCGYNGVADIIEKLVTLWESLRNQGLSLY